MAYVIDIKLRCDQQGCLSGARVEVFNTFNSNMGRYCRKHGTQRVKELAKMEKSGAYSNAPERRTTR